MASNAIIPAYDKFLDFLVEKASPEEILAFQLADEEIARAEELSDNNKKDRLTPDEAADLEQMLEFHMLVTLLKAKAAAALKRR